MRTELLTYLTANLTASIKPSQELPFEDSGNPLYLKNARKVYLAEPTTAQTVLVPLLNAADINETVTTVAGYLAVDAKNRNIDLDSALLVLANARTGANIPDSFRKEFDYTSTIDGSMMIYEFEYRFTNIA